MAYMAPMRNPNPKGQPAPERLKKHFVELPDLDIFKKVPGVTYFDPQEWHSFPFEYNDAVYHPRRKKGGDDEAE